MNKIIKRREELTKEMAKATQEIESLQTRLEELKQTRLMIRGALVLCDELLNERSEDATTPE